jgi:hypothetical protein
LRGGDAVGADAAMLGALQIELAGEPLPFLIRASSEPIHLADAIAERERTAAFADWIVFRFGSAWWRH